MSVEQTLAERGQRYGDFADHAAIAQAIQDAIRLTRPNGWERLNDMQRQALTVIADKIARILSGDPNYADNWHDIQGYAKLVEDRLPVESPVACEPCGSTVLGWHKATCPVGGLAAFAQHLQRADAVAKPCADDPLGQRGHAELAAQLGANYAATLEMEKVEVLMPGQPIMRRGKSRVAELQGEIAQLLAEDEVAATEPAAQIDDESDRQKAVEQNGNDGAVYVNPWYGAPEWARFKAQDEDGEWWWYQNKPVRSIDTWVCSDKDENSLGDEYSRDIKGPENPNWRDTLIERP